MSALDQTTDTNSIEYLTSRMKRATAYNAIFTEDEIAEVATFVGATFHLDRSERQFEAVLATVCYTLSKRVRRYGDLSESDLEGRSRIEYWLDSIEIDNLAGMVCSDAKMPPLLQFEIGPGKKCGYCKDTIETGELRILSTSNWYPRGQSGPVVLYKSKFCCMAPECIAKLPMSTPEFDSSLPQDARATAVVAMAAALGSSKPSTRFNKIRKRKGDDDDAAEYKLKPEAIATIREISERYGGMSKAEYIERTRAAEKQEAC